MKAYFGLQNPPVKIRKIAIGDGSITSGQVFELLPVVGMINSSAFSQLNLVSSSTSSKRIRNLLAMTQMYTITSKNSEISFGLSISSSLIIHTLHQSELIYVGTT